MEPKPAIAPRLLRSPTDFEEAAADWMRVWGLRAVKRTDAGRDGGIDVESQEAVAQVKAWMLPVGSPEIQQLKGAAHDGRVALFFALTDYTAAAVQFADRAGVALFRFCGYNGEIETVNAHATTFVAGRTETPKAAMNLSEHPIRNLIEQRLTKVLQDPGSFLVLEVNNAANRYVQVIWSSEGGLSVEAVSDEYLSCSDSLTQQELVQLAELGWPDHLPGENYRIELRVTSANSTLLRSPISSRGR